VVLSVAVAVVVVVVVVVMRVEMEMVVVVDWEGVARGVRSRVGRSGRIVLVRVVLMLRRRVGARRTRSVGREERCQAGVRFHQGCDV
jgi:hypothetical protein